MREETRRILLKINGQIHFGLAREGPVVAESRLVQCTMRGLPLATKQHIKLTPFPDQTIQRALYPS